MNHRESSHQVSITGPDRITARDPNARCLTCGVRGTIALFEHDAPPHTIERYCDACWRARRDALEAAGIHGGWEVLSWRYVEEFLDIVEQGLAANRARGELTPAQEAALPAQLKQIAADILQHASDYDEPMPDRIGAFVRHHHGPAA